MPDVKHVGGFGPLLDVLKMGAGRIEISPHNPSGPISTAASLHAAAVHPELVRSLEYSFQRQPTRRSDGRAHRNGVLVLGDEPGWGVAPPLLVARGEIDDREQLVAAQIAAHVLGDQRDRAVAAEVRARRDVRRDDHVAHAPERVARRQRLGIRDVESRAADLTRLAAPP